MINWQGSVLITTIIVMMVLVFVITRFISSSPKSIYYTLVNGYIRGNLECKRWVKEYNVYYWSLIFNVCLIIMILSLAGSLSQMKFLSRPEWALLISPPLWFSLYKCIIWYHKNIPALR